MAKRGKRLEYFSSFHLKALMFGMFNEHNDKSSKSVQKQILCIMLIIAVVLIVTPRYSPHTLHHDHHWQRLQQQQRHPFIYHLLLLLLNLLLRPMKKMEFPSLSCASPSQIFVSCKNCGTLQYFYLVAKGSLINNTSIIYPCRYWQDDLLCERYLEALVRWKKIATEEYLEHPFIPMDNILVSGFSKTEKKLLLDHIQHIFDGLA